MSRLTYATVSESGTAGPRVVRASQEAVLLGSQNARRRSGAGVAEPYPIAAPTASTAATPAALSVAPLQMSSPARVPALLTEVVVVGPDDDVLVGEVGAGKHTDHLVPPVNACLYASFPVAVGFAPTVTPPGSPGGSPGRARTGRAVVADRPTRRTRGTRGRAHAARHQHGQADQHGDAWQRGGDAARLPFSLAGIGCRKCTCAAGASCGCGRGTHRARRGARCARSCPGRARCRATTVPPWAWTVACDDREAEPAAAAAADA